MINNELWTISDESIVNPESTYYSAEAKAIFVSNVVGDELTKDGQGWISKISPKGEIIEAKWVEGLNAPHGMRAYQGKLWVADIDELVVIDIESATVISKIPIPGSSFLNDVVISDDGKVFVSDTITNEIYLVDGEEVTVFAEGSELEAPNGLLIKDNNLLVAAWGNITDFNTFATEVPGNVFQLDLNSKQKDTITSVPLGNLDGIELDLDGNFIVSDYIGGELFVINPTEEKQYKLISGLEGTADIGFVPDENLVVVPSLSQSTVTGYQYKPTLDLSQNSQLLTINGDVEQAKLQFHLDSKDLEQATIDEVGVFVVDDLEGRIDGLLPGQDGYLEAALSRAKTIFSVIPDNFVSDPSRILNSFGGQFLSFYLVENGTTDEVLVNSSAHNKVHLGTPVDSNGSSIVQITTLNDGKFQISFQDDSTDQASDLVLSVDLTQQSPVVGTQLQGQQQGELADLRDLTGQQVQVSFPIIDSEAVYSNTVGFYRVENDQGTVIDPLTGLEFNPGDGEYTEAALRNSQQLGISLGHNSENPTDILAGGYLYAPFLIADGTLEETLASLDQNNDPEIPVYFAYLEANWDGVDHVRLLGDNTWGFEDLAHGGDQDFNDLVLQTSFV